MLTRSCREISLSFGSRTDGADDAKKWNLILVEIEKAALAACTTRLWHSSSAPSQALYDEEFRLLLAAVDQLGWCVKLRGFGQSYFKRRCAWDLRFKARVGQ